MIVYQCPKCGGSLYCVSTASIPPYTYYQCSMCDWRSSGKREEMIAIPYPEPVKDPIKLLKDFKDIYCDPDKCKGCVFTVPEDDDLCLVGIMIAKLSRKKQAL